MKTLKKLISSVQEYFGWQEGVRIGRIEGSFFRSETLTERELNHHVHIVGASGFGKTVLLTKILKDRIRKGEGCLWVDLKGDRDSIEELIGFVEKESRRSDLQIFSISHPEISETYNLLGSGNATEIRDRIISALIWSEEFYKSQAMSYLLKLLTVMVYLRDKGELILDLNTVYRGTTSEQFLLDLSLKIPKNDLRYREMIESCYGYLTKRETQGNLVGLNAQLESFLLSNFGGKLSHTEEGIDLFQAVNQGKIVFIFLDSRRYGESAKALARMLIKDLIATSARIDDEIPKLKRRPFVCFIDEFADIAQEDFTAFPDRARSSKMSLVLSHQDLADLKRVSDTFPNRLTANMATLYAFLQSNFESAEVVAKRAGTKTIWRETVRASKFGWWSVRTGEGSLREAEEYRVHPNMVKSLGVGECVVVKKYPHARSHVVRVDEK